jgi:hypothetical protein
MATNTQLLLTESFTSQDSITITHNLNRLDLNIRVIIGEVARPDLVNDITFTSGNERNEFTVRLTSSNTGVIQVLDTTRYPVNLPTPENSAKLVDLPQASEITDTFVSGVTLNSTTLELERTEGKSTLTTDLSSINTDRFVTGATLNSTTLELERNGGLSDVTVDLSSIAGGTDKFVSGGTFNTNTVNIDFVGNSSDTTFSVDMGIIQHDRQSTDVSNSNITTGSYVSFTNPLSLTTGNLGTNGDYLITFNCYFDNASDSQNWVILEIDGSTVATTERMHEIKGKDQKGEDRIITLAHLATDVASGTVIEVKGKTTGGTFGLHRGTLIIDGIRTTNNIANTITE